MAKAKTLDNHEENAASEALPQALGRYKIIHEVGRGATAYVYKAYDPQLDRFLAVKVLRKELAQDSDYKNAFLKEARLAAQLTHPGIVTIYDVGIADNNPYIAMELLDGMTLENVLKGQGKLNLNSLLAIAIQLARALSYAHDRSVIHRDIKPGNIVVLKDKKTVKLTDFGIAQLDESLNAHGKSSDKVLGTPEYMAPEQVLGQSMDNRSDLYSFGILIYQMLMGLPPFVSDDLGKLFTQIIKKKPPAILIDEERIEDDLRDLISKLIQKQPVKRYQNAAMVAIELRSIQNKLGKKNKQHGKKFTSLSWRWTATMASVVLLATCISLSIVYLVQNKALSSITFDYGHSIAQMIAFKTAESIVLDDKIGLAALVKESSKNEQLESIYVLDVDNIILASTELTQVDQKFSPPDNRKLKQVFEDAIIYQRQVVDDTILFDIKLPIFFADKLQGYLYVSYNADSMYAASRTTLLSIFAVMLITLLITFVVTLILARRTSRDFSRITQALNKIATGRLDARLISNRKDEAGNMFAAFNRLASYFERHLSTKDNHETSVINPQTKPKKYRYSAEQSLAETVKLNIISGSDSKPQRKNSQENNSDH